MAAILSVTESTKKLSLVNATGDDSQSLQDFLLPDLQQFTREGVYSNTASKDFHLFYVGRDNVHEILKYVLSRCSVSLYLNMFGYDDDELNQILMGKVMDPAVTVLIALNKSQACGPVSPGKGYKAQNNTPSIFTDPDTINRFQTELIAEHVIAQKQAGGGKTKSHQR